MSTDVVVESSIGRIRRVSFAWCVTLAVGWTTLAVAGATEDLVSAAHRGDVAAIQALIAKGADVNAKNIEGGTALGNASFEGHVKVVRVLLDKGADVNAQFGIGVTALTQASQQGHLDVVQALLANGADVNAKNNEGTTALMMASQKGHLDIVQALLAKNADVNARTNDGRTALMLAKGADVRALLAQAGGEGAASPEQDNNQRNESSASQSKGTALRSWEGILALRYIMLGGEAFLAPKSKTTPISVGKDKGILHLTNPPL